MSAIILCYHKVGPQKDEGRRLNVDPNRLHSQISYFQRRGYRFVRASELAEPWSEKTVCLTFDDAYWSTLEWGLPVLDNLGVPGTLYAVSSLVGRSSVWDPSNPRPLAGWDSLESAQNRGHEIGNHTDTHLRMAGFSERDQARAVMAGDRALREHGIVPSSFCYPYGSYDARSISALAEGGYKVGLALEKRVAEDSDNRLALPRIVVGFSDSTPMLLYKIWLRPRLRRGV
jgi:peptidoglycan/xylan/chitin deacetylase (PgdA/CDA1 family)